MHMLSVPIHFSALIISTLARVGTADPTKHEWPLCYPYRVLSMVPRNLIYMPHFCMCIDTVTVQLHNEKFDHTMQIDTTVNKASFE